jgi:uncharacterized protein YbjT (DUF2867 family)
MATAVAITGATGNVGRAVAERLLKRGVAVRAIGRTADRLRPLVARGAEAQVGDLADPDFLTRAFRDAGAVFAMIPQRFDVADYHADQRRLVAGVTAALEAARVPRVVALSTPGARLRLGLPAALADFEDRLRDIPGLSTVVLQPTYYMENFLASIPMIASADITGGAVRGDLAFPMVATRDVAEVAAGYLENPAFTGYAARVLLGPRDYTFREASGILGASIGKPDLAYAEIPYDGFRQGLVGAGVSASAADAFLDMIRAMNEERMLRGLARDASSTTPATLEEFARDVFAPVYRGTA